MAKKMWGGRFAAKTHPLLESYSESISFDRRLAQVDIRGSIAHAKMLKKVGLLSAKEESAIREGLTSISRDILKDKFEYKVSDEDIHMAIEAELTRRIGDPARKLHTARSRNDQVATDFRLWCRERLDFLDGFIRDLQRNLLEQAAKYSDLVISGYTHLQRAQPVMLSQHLLAYIEMFARDCERIAEVRKRVNRLPLGACAMAGTTLPIDREFVRKELGFDALCENSMDAVSDRDFCVEIATVCSLFMAHISRLSEDIILWASTEWGLVKLADNWSTGSSIMPQKRNPDLLELARGKTARVYGTVTSLLALLKGLPMTYNRDLQEDKPQVFDALDTATATAQVFSIFVPSLEFNRDAAANMLEGGFLEATVIAEYLVEKGLPFRLSHEVSGRLVALVESRGESLSDLSLKDMKRECELFEADIHGRLTARNVPDHYKSAGSAGKKEVKKAITRWRRRLKK